MENKDIRRANLKALIEKHLEKPGNTKASFAILCGIAPAQLSQLTGDKSVRNIGDSIARRIEDANHLPNGWMDMIHDANRHYGDAEQLSYVGNLRPGLVRVVGEAVLGVDGAIEMTEDRDGWLKIHSDDPEAFGLKVKGDSMWPRIKSGEYVLIEPNTEVCAGDEVFVRTKEGHNMIKVLGYKRDGEYQFTSINQDHRPITLPYEEVSKVEYVAGILKQSRHLDDTEAREWAIKSFK
ncbi:TPA: helix-turn-helix transcriptional regulator [Klebsiella pneumoniae]|nr:helix-turn-helix transcriptional regulator [Klebsiella pneumoniae]